VQEELDQLQKNDVWKLVELAKEKSCQSKMGLPQQIG